MSRNGPICLLLMMSFFMTSCGPKFYYKDDYSFYKKGFALDEDSFLRTDGFYIPESEWQKKDSSQPKPEKYEVYRFFKTGQVNLILVDSLENNQEYFDAMNSQIDGREKRKQSSTLFQGYYQVKDTKIIIQQVNVSLRRFYYLYGYIEKNKLIFVKKTIEGDGEFREDYFTDTYKANYVFVPYDSLGEDLIPNW